jgi:uncharacterized protein YjbI with pentapeptide repeats
MTPGNEKTPDEVHGHLQMISELRRQIKNSKSYEPNHLNLGRLSIRGGRLIELWLSDALFMDSKFESVWFRYSLFLRSVFSRASFTKVRFIDSDLTTASFRDCEFKETDFKNTNLTGADFSGSTGLTTESLDEAWAWSDAAPTLPDGLNLTDLRTRDVAPSP